jgi:hypothetical protein
MINFTFENDNFELNEENLMEMADDMAAAATTFNNLGYENFIESREKFKEALHKFTTKR